MDEPHSLKHTHMHTIASTQTYTGSLRAPSPLPGMFHTELGVTHGNKFLRSHTRLKLLSR